MNTWFGDWYRKAAIQPSGEELTDRWRAIEGFVKKCDANKALELLRCFLSLAFKNPAVIQDFQQEFLNVDAAFPVANNEVLMQVLAASTLRSVIEQSTAVSDTAATFCVSAVAVHFRKPPIIPELLTIAQKYLFDRGIVVRQLNGRPRIVGAKHDQLIEAVKTACATNSAVQLGAPLENVLKSLNDTINKVAAGTEATVAALEKNEKLLLEESNIVWWIFGERSRINGERFSDLDPALCALLAGKELADLVKLLPGPIAAPAYLDRVIRNVDERKLNLSQLASSPNEQLLAALKTAHANVDLSPLSFIVSEISRGNKPADAVAVARKQLKLTAASAVSPLQAAMQMYAEGLAAKCVV